MYLCASAPFSLSPPLFSTVLVIFRQRGGGNGYDSRKVRFWPTSGVKTVWEEEALPLAASLPRFSSSFSSFSLVLRFPPPPSPSPSPALLPPQRTLPLSPFPPPFLAAVFRHSRIESTAGGRHTTVPPPKRRQTAPKEATTGPAAAHRSTCQQVGTQKGPAPTVFPPLRPLVSLPRFRGADSIRSLPASLDPFCRRPSSIRPPLHVCAAAPCCTPPPGLSCPPKTKGGPSQISAPKNGCAQRGDTRMDAPSSAARFPKSRSHCKEKGGGGKGTLEKSVAVSPLFFAEPVVSSSAPICAKISCLHSVSPFPFTPFERRLPIARKCCCSPRSDLSFLSLVRFPPPPLSLAKETSDCGFSHPPDYSYTHIA